MEGVQGTPYKIRNRSNKAYKLEDSDIPLLNGVYESNKEITLTYNAIPDDKPTSIELVPDTYRLSVGETVGLDYKLLPEADYEVSSVDYIMVENDNVANINDKVLTGREIGFGMIRVNAKGNGWELSKDGAVMVSGATEEGE